MSEETAATNNQQRVELQKIYIKDVSLETPSSPAIFQEKWEPKFEMEINTQTNQLSDIVYDVVLTITVTAKNGDKTAYLIELQQAGVFTVTGFNSEQVGQILGAFCPNTLFPYARETIDSLVVKGGFTPVQLSPVNFDALYMQHLQSQNENQAADAH